jgi:PAS domain S-box-containing protein
MTNRTETSLEIEETALSSLAVIESSNIAIISKDLTGRITSWNAGACRLYGYTPAEAIGQSITLVVPFDHASEPMEFTKSILTGQSVNDFETIRIRKDGTFVDVSLTVSPIYGSGGVVGASIVAIDISDRRRMETIKDESLALISHELRAPLSSIVAYAELLLDDDLLECNLRRQFMEVIDRNAMRLDRLVGDMLFVAQLESANLSLSVTAVDLVAVAAAAIEEVTPGAQRSGHEVRLSAPDKAIMVWGDGGRLGQAIDNLISNAIKYSPEGGVVDVRLIPDGDECFIEIEDHGMGIVDAEQEHLFDRFFRGSTPAKLRIQGVGLGLSIVKRIIESHGGRLSLFSESGAGSTFSIIIPLIDFSEPPAALSRTSAVTAVAS